MPQYVAPRCEAELWLSNRDGHAMRMVGSVLIAKDKDGGLVEGLDNLRWLPSDRKISFRYKDALWIVPVDDLR